MGDLTRSAQALFGGFGSGMFQKPPPLGNVQEKPVAKVKDEASVLAPPSPPPSPSPQQPAAPPPPLPPVSEETRTEYRRLYSSALQATSTRGGDAELNALVSA